jgi:hypothetical protein
VTLATHRPEAAGKLDFAGAVCGSQLMNIIQKSIKWVMVICGLLTCATSYVLFVPNASLQSALGVPSNPMVFILVRHWAALIGLFGLMLIYGAFKEAVRRMVLLATSAGKAVFISLVLLQGQHFVRSQAAPGLAIDSISVPLFATYLIATRKQFAA